jgi:hypothetical protein
LMSACLSKGKSEAVATAWRCDKVRMMSPSAE